MKKSASKLVKFVSGAALLSIAVSATAANYPNRPVRFIVPWPPGDLEDVLTRAIAEEMSKQTGVPASVVNKPGGGGVLGATTVAQSRPDGSVIGSFVVDLVTSQVVGGNAPYTADDFEPVGIFLDYPFVLATKADAPYSNLAELANYSKSHDISLGHFGYQALPTALTFKAADQEGIKIAADSAFDALDCATLANGDADIINTTTQLILPCLDSGDVKLLTSYTFNRLVTHPDVPTLNEATGIAQTLWNGLFVPKGTPREIKEKIAAIAQDALQTPQVIELQETTGAGVYWTNMDDAAKVIELDYANAQKLAQSAQ
ncbi:tripartite tricarboxylate transporter substrate binding protein [Maribrevibacterium harenarium]|uniref:Tripartite tricarboxylate transporter substrate binding protein n=1 Tax=Maribrevibacterium harenarium TaxID=2589817 RepID=A0A501X1T4_9GAMM|nr:tripartite tricarboxylate transporter substrate binding protein [Maribrevibacterium harenarium]TPE54439.1 tripartite tricarboxylate transporter substrate binding protein [Maribrevibacterium harenarium]